MMEEDPGLVVDGKLASARRKTQRSPEDTNSGKMLQGDAQRYERMMLSCIGKDFRSIWSCKA